MSEKKQTILEWYQNNHKFMDAPCNGKGNCGRCKVKFLSDAPLPREKEKELLTAEELENGVRLACMTEWQEDMSFETDGVLFHEKQMVIPGVTGEQKGIVIEEVEENALFGVALDIGTTTIAMSLVSLGSGVCLGTITAANRQRAFGADVISRIQAANDGNGEDLQISILQNIWEMLLELVELTDIKPKQIKRIAIAGNTTMCHLLLGYSCEGLGRAPFTVEDIGLRKLGTAQLFDKIKLQVIENDIYEKLNAEVVILPGISAFVGADMVAGMYFCDMDLSDEEQVLLDIGTNGEIAIGNRKGFRVTSTAAGPVFEGGNISCGVPAVKGAISHATLQKNTDRDGESQLRWTCEILGEIQRKRDNQEEANALGGVCGSGLIDIVAALWKEGLLDENGTLTEPFFDTGVPIEQLRITQTDIREVQMGKAAIRAGLEILLEKARCRNLYLAGGFGSELSIDSAVSIGLLPESIRNCVIPKGNTSLLGLRKFLLDSDGEVRVQNIAEKSRQIILAETGNFEEKYIHFMQFLL